MAPAPSGRKKARIEIIPLIDVIFFLLATFILFTLSLNKSEAIAPAREPHRDQRRYDLAQPRVHLQRDEQQRKRDPADHHAPRPGGRLLDTELWL